MEAISELSADAMLVIWDWIEARPLDCPAVRPAVEVCTLETAPPTLVRLLPTCAAPPWMAVTEPALPEIICDRVLTEF